MLLLSIILTLCIVYISCRLRRTYFALTFITKFIILCKLLLIFYIIGCYAMNIHREIISAIEIWSHSIISVLLGNNIYFASTSNRGFVTGWDNTGYVPPLLVMAAMGIMILIKTTLVNLRLRSRIKSVFCNRSCNGYHYN